MIRRFLACLFGTLLAASCGPAEQENSSDFAILAAAADGYAQARPGYRLAFPRDHGPHPEFRIEWWYLTANLEDSSGRQYGAQWTLFRTATEPPGHAPPANAWLDPQRYMAHFALSWPEGHRAWQRYARGGQHDGLARAGARPSPFSAWLDDWELSSEPGGDLPMQAIAEQDGFAMNLTLDSSQDWVLQGDEGFSQKHPGGGGSFYYSHPFLRASGTLTFEGEPVSVSGMAWLDREWSSQFLKADQQGWDWFALHLDSGEKLMVFQLRSIDGSRNYRHAVLLHADGARQAVDTRSIRLSPLEFFSIAGRNLPLRWNLELPDLGRTLEIEALHPDQWMDVDFPYWEGVVLASGDGPGNRGKGYMELTGYPREKP